MTARVVGSYGTLTRTVEEFDLTVRTTLAGTLTVPAGTWRARAVVSDTCGSSSSAVTANAGANLAVSLDHMTMKAAGARSIDDAVVVEELVTGNYVARAETTPAPEEIEGAPPPSDAKIGVVMFMVQPGIYPTPDTYPYESWLDAMPPGIDVVRVGLAWPLLQPDSAAFSATWGPYYDAVFAELASRDISVIITLGGTPQWASGSADPLQPPTSAATFGQYVDDVIDRWGDVVEILSIDPWNEPNSNSFFPGTDAQYVGLLRAAHNAAAGRVSISLGSLAFADWVYVEGLFAGASLTASDFDAVDFHPYPIGFFGPSPGGRWLDPASPVNDDADDRQASLACGYHMLETTLAAHGAPGRDFYVSETGAPGPNIFDASNVLRMTDERAAAFVFSLIDQAKRIPAIKALTIHEAVSRSDNDTWNAKWGLLNSDLSRRKKWAVVAAATGG